MNSDMVKSEKFGHLHLVYHITVPLNLLRFKFIGYEILPILLKMYIHKLLVISNMINFQVTNCLSDILNLARTLLK